MNPFDLSLCQLYQPEVIADPYPFYRRLQQEDPVHWDPFLHNWVVTAYTDVQTVQQRYSSATVPSPEMLQELGCEALIPVTRVLRMQMAFSSGKAHARLRNTAARAFTPRYLEATRRWMQERAAELIEELADRGSMDVLEDFSARLTTELTGRMLGIPAQHHAALKGWAVALIETLANFQLSADRSETLGKSIAEASAYVQDLIRDLERQPRENVTYALMTGEYEGTRLSEEEVTANVLFLMAASQVTSSYIIGNALICLLRHPEQLARVRANTELIPAAVEEALRFESPSQYVVRIAPADARLGGKRIEKGQTVIAVIGAANRDPQQFPDPDRFDVGRRENRHLAFGWGPHFCLGAALARMEAPIALSLLLHKLDELAFDPQAPFVWQSNPGFRGPVSLPVRFRRAPAASELHLASV